MNPNFPALLTDPLFASIIIGLALWSTIWKGFALYRAGANRSPIWFTVLLVVNTLGILEMVYLFAISKKTPSDK